MMRRRDLGFAQIRLSCRDNDTKFDPRRTSLNTMASILDIVQPRDLHIIGDKIYYDVASISARRKQSGMHLVAACRNNTRVFALVKAGAAPQHSVPTDAVSIASLIGKNERIVVDKFGLFAWLCKIQPSLQMKDVNEFYLTMDSLRDTTPFIYLYSVSKYVTQVVSAENGLLPILCQLHPRIITRWTYRINFGSVKEARAAMITLHDLLSVKDTNALSNIHVTDIDNSITNGQMITVTGIDTGAASGVLLAAKNIVLQESRVSVMYDSVRATLDADIDAVGIDTPTYEVKEIALTRQEAAPITMATAKNNILIAAIAESRRNPNDTVDKVLKNVGNILIDTAEMYDSMLKTGSLLGSATPQGSRSFEATAIATKLFKELQTADVAAANVAETEPAAAELASSMTPLSAAASPLTATASPLMAAPINRAFVNAPSYIREQVAKILNRPHVQYGTAQREIEQSEIAQHETATAIDSMVIYESDTPANTSFVIIDEAPAAPKRKLGRPPGKKNMAKKRKN